jgi:PPOX class probable F420-dependent enzyme
MGAMEIPRVGRPHMPGYGIVPATEGSGLLPWSWAAERLTRSRNYWVSSVWPDGRPHSMPVWGMWDDAVLWFSSSIGSRKTRNLAANPQCCVTTEDATDPVVLEGTARIVNEPALLQRVVDLMNAKYGTGYDVDFLSPARNATIRVRPRRVFGLRSSDFTGSPTRWIFEDLQRHSQDGGRGGARGTPGGFHGELYHVAGMQAGRDHRCGHAVRGVRQHPGRTVARRAHQP